MAAIVAKEERDTATPRVQPPADQPMAPPASAAMSLPVPDSKLATFMALTTGERDSLGDADLRGLVSSLVSHTAALEAQVRSLLAAPASAAPAATESSPLDGDADDELLDLEGGQVRQQHGAEGGL